MDQKPLGRTGCTISAIGLGCVTFGREIDEPTSIQIMDYALEKGLTFFDTAEAYGGGQSKLGRQQQLGVVDQREVNDRDKFLGAHHRRLDSVARLPRPGNVMHKGKHRGQQGKRSPGT